MPGAMRPISERPRQPYDPAEILFNAAAEIGVRFVMGRGGLTVGRPWHRCDIPPAPTESIDQMLQGLEATVKRWHDPSAFSMRRVAASPVTTVFNLRPAAINLSKIVGVTGGDE